LEKEGVVNRAMGARETLGTKTLQTKAGQQSPEANKPWGGGKTKVGLKGQKL